MLGIAMAAIFLKRGQEKTEIFPSIFMAESRFNTRKTESMQLTPWQRKVAQATPPIPIDRHFTKRISTRILALEEKARK